MSCFLNPMPHATLITSSTAVSIPLSALLSWFSSYLHRGPVSPSRQSFDDITSVECIFLLSPQKPETFLRPPPLSRICRVHEGDQSTPGFLCCIFPVSHPFHSLSFTDAPVPFYPHEHLCTFTLPKYASIKNNCLVCPLDFQPWGPFTTVGTLGFWIFGGKIAGLLSTSSLCLALGTRVGEL